MPAGGDLGFSYPVVVLVVLVGQVVIAFVVRRKWRISAARREEIKRLLVLASEEAARAELEASFGYDATPAAISPPLQYQCAVCFCPTTTRCARCKAVRYCSGKCQIIHWRQGHREECRPFASSYESNDKGGGSCQKLLKQEEYEINGNSFETDGRPYAKSGHNFPEEPAYSNSPENERSDGHQSTNIYPDKLEAGRVNNVDENSRPSSKGAVSLDSLDGLTSSGKLNQIEPGCTDQDSQCGSTSSSGWSADGSNESSFSEPSTPSSGFWDGTLNFSKPKVDALDDSAESSSSSTGEADLQNSQSSSFSFKLHRNAVPPVIEQGSGANAVILDEHNSTALKIKEPFKRSVLSQEISKNVSKDKSSLLLSPNRSDMDDYASSDSPESKSKEPRYCSASTYAYPTSSAGGPSISAHASKVSSMCSLKPERSNHVVNDTSTTSHPVERKEGRSLSPSASVAHLSSSTGRRSLQGAKPRKIESAHAIASTSENAWYSPNARNGLKTSTLKVVDQLRAPISSRHCQSEVGSEITRRYNIKGLFPYEVFVKLYNWNKAELQPFGLTNCGNSCYANAVLQCLACTPPLTAYLLEGIHRKTCERKEWCFTCEFESLILKAKEGTSPLSPFGILSQIQNIGRHLGNGREEDAHEFLRYAIDTMQSVCLKEARVNASSSLEEETSLVGLTFGGYLRSKIKCLKCGGKSERHERMMDLTVEIDGDIGTLEEALRQFTGTEILDGENKYQCSRCRSYERAKKKLTVQEAPNILTIALKRFQSGKFGKLNKSIRFPEILDLAPYMSRTSDKSPVYRLYGVVVHLGLMNASFSGHYVCYVKNAQKKWFKIDDSMVTAVELGSVLAERAYMLLYARCSPRAPRLLRDSIIPRDPRKAKTPTSKSRATPTSPWDASTADPSSGHPGIECLYPNHASFQPTRKIFEEDSSSENSSSIFSEECSCSTGSSSNRYSSDSDSTSSPSPSYSRHSPLADSDRYSSRKPDTSNGFWARQPNRSSNSEGKSCVPILNSDITKPCRKVESSSSSCCRETDSGRLGWANPKSDGVTFGRTD